MKSSANNRWLTLISLLTLLFGWASTGVMIYIRIFLLISLILLASYFWNLLSIKGIQISRRSRSLRTSVGKVFDERYDVQNTSRLACFWLEIDNLAPLPQKSGSRLLTGIGGFQQRSYTARTRITKRGAYPLGPTMLSSGDPFGLFVCIRKIPPKNTLIVLPLTVEIPYFPSPTGVLPGGKEIHQQTLDVTPHASGVREYIPGDPIKRVHWPSTARRDQLMVKNYEQDTQAEIWFFLDSDRDVHFSLAESKSYPREDYLNINRRDQIKLPDDTYEYAISATASLAKYFLQQKRAVGLVSSGKKFTVIPSERGERQVGKLLETLAFLKSDGKLPLLGCVGLQAKHLPMGSGGILVTPSLNPDILIAVEDLARRKLHPMVILILPESFGGPPGGEEIIEGLNRHNVPLFTLTCGKNLDSQLGQIKGANKNSWSPI
jgi:uncharacterized protein (DUF58 family)